MLGNDCRWFLHDGILNPQSRTSLQSLSYNKSMRFFTKQWHGGELSDAAFDAVPAAYRHHLSSLALPPEVLAICDLDNHDGLILDAEHEPQLTELTLRLRCGDLQRGYFDLHIKYLGAILDSASLSVLRQAMQLPKDEILYDEVDRAGTRFVHRYLLSSHEEIMVTFLTVTVSSTPVSSRGAV